MKKVLFLATYPYQSNGYAKVANKITNYLANFYEVYYFGFSNYKDTYIPRDVHPSIKIIDVVEEENKRNLKDAFGVEIIEDTIKEIEPDIVIIYNDIIVTCNHLNVLNRLRYEEEYDFKVTNNGESSSILELGTHKEKHPHIFVTETKKLKSKTLNSIISENNLDMSNFNFLNLDIQGAELLAIKGLGEQIDKIDYIYTEVNVDYLYENCALMSEIDEYLNSFGFSRVDTKILDQ
jgi:FkbM family methyltransferase